MLHFTLFVLEKGYTKLTKKTKNTWKKTLKTWKNHGRIMEFCWSAAVGTLSVLLLFSWMICWSTHNVILCPAQIQNEICVNVLCHVLQHFLPEKNAPSYVLWLRNALLKLPTVRHQLQSVSQWYLAVVVWGQSPCWCTGQGPTQMDLWPKLGVPGDRGQCTQKLVTVQNFWVGTSVWCLRSFGAPLVGRCTEYDDANLAF